MAPRSKWTLSPDRPASRSVRRSIGALATFALLAVATPLTHAAPIVYELSGFASTTLGQWTLRLEADTTQLVASGSTREIISTSGTFSDNRGTFTIVGGQFGFRCSASGTSCVSGGSWDLRFLATGAPSPVTVWQNQRLDPAVQWDLVTPINTSHCCGAGAQAGNEFRVNPTTMIFEPGTPSSPTTLCIGNPCGDLYDGGTAQLRRIVVSSPVPLPAAVWLLLGGLGGLSALRRRRPMTPDDQGGA